MTVLARQTATLRAYPPTLGVIAQVAVLVVLGATVGLDAAGWLVGLAFTLGTAVLLSRALQQPDVVRWGPADSITFGRLILTGGATALVVGVISGAGHRSALIGLAAASLLLDAVDGQVARRTASTSRFGARFDMEADSVLAIVLSVYIATTLGWWAVSIGLFRYAFVLASWALPWLTGQLLPRMSRKVVAASQGAVLVVASSGLLPTLAAQVLVLTSIATLVWSFGADMRWLWQQESARRAQRRHAVVRPRANSDLGAAEPVPAYQ